MSEAKSSGLDGVVVADTAISDVDGERGRLVIAGADVEQLALTATSRRGRHACSPPAVRAPTPTCAARSARARAAAWEMLPRLGDALDAPDGMDALRAALAHLRSTRRRRRRRARRDRRGAGVRRRVEPQARGCTRRSRRTPRSATPPTTCA